MKRHYYFVMAAVVMAGCGITDLGDGGTIGWGPEGPIAVLTGTVTMGGEPAVGATVTHYFFDVADGDQLTDSVGGYVLWVGGNDLNHLCGTRLSEVSVQASMDSRQSERRRLDEGLTTNCRDSLVIVLDLAIQLN